MLERMHVSKALCFNPRARTERDFYASRSAQVTTGFNPRARTERDNLFYIIQYFFRCFNPRARTERDAPPR